MALKDKDGNIIWSWHIWATDKPAEQVYKNNAGTMMDRNLGATTGTPGIKETVGLYYQWGRKDPFLGSTEVDASGTAVCTGGELPIVTDCTAETGTIDYTISHPTTFIKFNFDRSTGAGNSDWLYDNKEKVNGDYPIYEKERWTSSKSIYEAYKVWCEDNVRKPLSANRLSSELTQNAAVYNVEPTNNIYSGGRRVRGFVGIEVVARPFG